ncbi:MAG: 50S ribosomal protein L5 [Nitrospinota bacterium]
MAKKEKETGAAGKAAPDAPVEAGEEKGRQTGQRQKGPAPRREPSRLCKRYLEEIVPQLRKEFNYKNVMQVPRLEKVVVNMGLGEAIQNPKALDSGVEELAAITGQKPVITRARKSIAAFKVRTGMSIGAMVSLRGDHMYEFLDRLMNVALPRVRDFRGVSGKAFDGRGNYSLGLREQVIFPEINYDKVDRVRGLGVCVVTTAKTDEEGKALLRHLGMPFRE